MYATNARENNTHGSELTSGEVTSIFANSFFSDSMSRRDYFSDDRYKRLNDEVCYESSWQQRLGSRSTFNHEHSSFGVWWGLNWSCSVSCNANVLQMTADSPFLWKMSLHSVSALRNSRAYLSSFPRYQSLSETHGCPLLRHRYLSDQFAGSVGLHRRDLLGHYGCVNAIEFSNNGGEFIVSGRTL